MRVNEKFEIKEASFSSVTKELIGRTNPIAFVRLKMKGSLRLFGGVEMNNKKEMLEFESHFWDILQPSTYKKKVIQILDGTDRIAAIGDGRSWIIAAKDVYGDKYIYSKDDPEEFLEQYEKEILRYCKK